MDSIQTGARLIEEEFWREHSGEDIPELNWLEMERMRIDMRDWGEESQKEWEYNLKRWQTS